jgi:tetratricopeptide (TPR) repeat protein
VTRQPGKETPEDLDGAIEVMQEMLAAGEPDPQVAAALGQALAGRYSEQGDDGDRDEAITWLRQACDAPVPAGHDPDDDLQLAMLLIDRGGEHGDVADVEAGLGYAERGPGGDLPSLVPYVLGVGHLLRAEFGQMPADFPVAVGYLREAAAPLPEDSPERAEVNARLGVALAMWVHADAAMDGTDAFDEAILLLARAREEIPPEDAYRFQVRYWLATALTFRFMWSAGSLSDLERALAEFEVLLSEPGIPAGMADLGHIFSACLLLYRVAPESVRRRSFMMDASHLGRLYARPPERISPDAARSAAAHLDQVSGSAIPESAASLVPWLRGVASLALSGSALQQGGNPDPDINPPVAALEEALRLMPEDDPTAGELQGLLGMAYALQEGVGASGHVPGRSAGSLLEAARQLGDEHPMVPLLQSMLGGAFGFPLGGREPSREESAAAIDLLENVIEEIPDDHPARADTLVRLGSLLITRGFSLDRPVPSLKKLRRQLEDTIKRPAASPLNDAINHCLLGMAEGVEGLLTPDPALIATSIDRLKRAAEIAPAEPRARDLIQAGIICLLSQRYTQEGDFQYLDAALYYAGQIAQTDQEGKLSDPLLFAAQYLLASGPAVRNPEALDQDRVNEMIARLETLQGRLPDGHPMRLGMSAELSALRVVRGGLGVFKADGRAVLRGPGGLAEIAEAADGAVAVARATSQDDPFYALNLSMAGNAQAMLGVLRRDRRTIGAGIGLLAEACAAAAAVPEHRRRMLSLLGWALWMRYDITRDRSDLNNMISRLEEARRLADEDQGGTDWASILYASALGYYTRNDRNLHDRRRACAFGLSSLRGRSATVLLQSTADRAFDAAIDAAGEAADVVRWCLADGNPEAAVEALERGRGMVLHAAVADASVPLLLRETGHADLASTWEEALRAAENASPDPWDVLPGMVAALRSPSGGPEDLVQSPEVRLPDDLRHRVVHALRGTALERLLAPPSLGEIAQALRAAGARALVYLMPRDATSAGLALVVNDKAEVREIPLPLLMIAPRGPVTEFAQAQRAVQEATPAPEDIRGAWEQALGDLCGWAWTAAMEDVLDSVVDGPGRTTRIVLVPVGDLGVVPWHAARRPVAGGDLRYACQDAVISYAASARQFTEACRHRHRPWRSAAAMVRVPGSRLFFASREVQEIHRRHYADGTLLGGDPRARASADNVRELLPRLGAAGVSLLHLGCHAEPALRPVDGRLLLENGETLSMRDILFQARARPAGTPGCLVVLAACGSDLTGGHHDEALTLATSFLAAGAVGAIGTRWPVADLPTLAFMTMFHHYLNSGYDNPSTALRAAQSWMLNPDRSFAGDFHPKIAEMARKVDLTRAEYWAAFTYQGQ